LFLLRPSLSSILYRTSVIARAFFPKQSPLATRGLLRREERPPRNDEFTRICTVENLPKEIEDWIEDEATALCPHCGIDSVIGSKSGYPITAEFLQKMKEHWFDS
jgi:hypothetical protein